MIRGKKKITLTEEGVILRKRAEEIIELVEKTEQEIGYDLEEVMGYQMSGKRPFDTHIIIILA